LGVSNAIVNPVSGANAAAFATPIAVVAGTRYYLAYLSDTTFAAAGINLSSTWGDGSQTYTGGFPSSMPSSFFAATGNANQPQISLTNTWSSASSVSEITEDGDTTYVSSATVGQEDLYTLTALPASLSAILGLTFFAYAKRADSGPRTLAVQANLSGTEVAAANSAAIGFSYGYVQGFQPLDPAGASWTIAHANALTIGPKIAA
jgi:hypothetical protein